MAQVLRQLALIAAAVGAALPAYATPLCGCEEHHREHAVAGTPCEGSASCCESAQCCEPRGSQEPTTYELIGCCVSGACECDGCDGPLSAPPQTIEATIGESMPVLTAAFAPACQRLDVWQSSLTGSTSLEPSARPPVARRQAVLCVWLI